MVGRSFVHLMQVFEYPSSFLFVSSGTWTEEDVAYLLCQSFLTTNFGDRRLGGGVKPHLDVSEWHGKCTVFLPSLFPVRCCCIAELCR